MRRGGIAVGLSHLDHPLEVLALHVGGADPVLRGTNLFVGPGKLVLWRVLLLEKVAFGEGTLELRVRYFALCLRHRQPGLRVGFVGADPRQRVLGASDLDSGVVHRLHLRFVEPGQA